MDTKNMRKLSIKTVESADERLSAMVLELKIATEMADKYEQIKKEKEKEIIEVMKKNGMESFESGDVVVEHHVPGYGMRLDGELLKTEVPDIYLAYSVPVPVKEKLVMRKKNEIQK